MYIFLKIVIFYATICKLDASHPHFSVFRTENTFRCETGRFLIPMSTWCDGHRDCPDGSDEFHCNPPSTINPKDSLDSLSTPQSFDPLRLEHNFTRCDFGQAACADVAFCIPLLWFCDGDRDCPNGFDEEDCAYKLSSGENKSVKERLHEEPVDQSSSKFIVHTNSSPHYQSCNKFLIIALVSVTLKAISMF